MSNKIDVMYRLIWNTNGWRAPSGDFYEDKDTWGSKQGFGHEEWNFQIKDAVDDYVFAYVYARPARVAEIKTKFRVVFYSIAPDGKWYLIGEYSKAEVSTSNDSIKLDQHFEDNRIYDERTDQLISITSDRESFLGHNFTKLGLSRRRKIIRENLKDSILNEEYILKCPVNEVNPYPGGIPAESNLLKELLLRGKQYTRPFYPTPLTNTSSPTKSKGAKKKVLLDEGSYWRLSPKKKHLVWKRHNLMSNNFAKWLKQEGYKKVNQEANRVDVEFSTGPELCRAELKICGEGKPLWSIREAVGQLFEYNLYGNRKPAQNWFIILDEKPHQWDFEFIETMRNNYNIPIWLGWQDGNSFSLEKNP